MLSPYFGFKEEPFGATPDPRWLYRSNTHREALASLRYAFFSNRGFTALIAPPGMGKTTLLNQFLQDIRRSARSVFVFDTQCDAVGLLRYILRDLGVAPANTGDEMHEQLKEVLVKESRAGRRVVIVVDEAQNLSDEALEMLRLLTNFETQRAKLLQIVLAGQPALSDKLTKLSLEQLRQRISTICWLEPFSMRDTTAYIRHRLEQAGYRGEPLFRKDALKLITSASQGTPRIINTLCFNSLSICCALKSKQVDRAMVAEVITDLELDQASRESAAASAVSASEALPDLELLPDLEQTGFAAWRTRLLVAAAALLVVVSGLGMFAYSAHRQSSLHMAQPIHSPDTKAVAASAPVPATTSLSGAIVAQPTAKPAAATRPASLPTLAMHVTRQNTIAVPLPKASPSDTKFLASIFPTPEVSDMGRSAGADYVSNGAPFQVTVQPDQTLQDIATRNLGAWNLKILEQIKRLNPNLKDLDHLEAGQKIWLPAPESTRTAQDVMLQANKGEHHEP